MLNKVRRQVKLALVANLLIGSSAVAMAAEYTVPDSFIPVSHWKEKISAEEAHHYRNDYTAIDYMSGNNNAAYFYLHVNELITTATLRRSGPVAMFEERPMPEIANTKAVSKIGEKTLAEVMEDERSRLQAYAVVHKGKLVYEAYPGMQQEQTHIWNSASKTITGVLIHKLAQEGKIDLQKTAEHYLPEFKGSPVGKTKLVDFLHHRSGLDIIENQPNLEDPNHPIGRSANAAVTHRGASVDESLTDILLDVKALDTKKPGEVFDYSTLNTQVLGKVIEVVSGMKFSDYASENLWSTVGMERDGVLGLSASGDPLNGGIIASTLRDFARYATSLTPSWSSVTQMRPIDDSYYQNVKQAADIESFNKGGQGQRMTGDFGKDSGLIGSSYQWDAVFSDGDMYKAGLNGQGIYVSPETDTAIVWFSTAYRNSYSAAMYARAVVEQHFR